MNQKKKLSRKVISYVLALLMVFSTLTGIAPGTKLTAHAATDTYTNLIPTGEEDATALAAKKVFFNGYQWFIIEDNSVSIAKGTVTLLAAEDSFGSSVYSDKNDDTYENSIVKTYLANIFTEKFGKLKPDTIENNCLYLLSEDDVYDLNIAKNVLSTLNYWWLCTPGPEDNDHEKRMKFIYGYVTTNS